MMTAYYVGLDVHKDTIQMAVLGNQGKEPVTAKGLPNDPYKVVKALAPYQEKGDVQVAYEAGCMGYTLYRSLTEFGFDCRVIPPNKVFHRGGTEESDRRSAVKTDKRDAVDIAWMLRRDEGESIAIPSQEDEAARDLIRCHSDLKDDQKRGKQRLLKFLLRHGYHYDTDNYWTKRYYDWLKSIQYNRLLEKETFDQYLSHITNLEDRIGRIDATIKEVAESEVYAERVRKFRAFKGVDYLIALSLGCEIGDFKRFPTAQSFMSYLGLVPRENSSEKKRQQGGITKTGNGHLRKLLTEAPDQRSDGNT
jgi:transposase